MKENETFREFRKRIRKKELYLCYDSIKKLKELYKDLIELDEKKGREKRASKYILRLKVRRIRIKHFKNRIRNFGKFFRAFKTSIFVGKWYKYPCYIWNIFSRNTIIGWRIDQLPYKIRHLHLMDKIRDNTSKLHRCISGRGEDRCKNRAEVFIRGDDGKRLGYFCYNCYQDIAQSYWESAYDL